MKFLFLGTLFFLLAAGIQQEAFAQGKSKARKQKHEYRQKQHGPPAWAPAHGYRRKHEAEASARHRRHRDERERRERTERREQRKKGSIFKRFPIPLPERTETEREKKRYPFPTKTEPEQREKRYPLPKKKEQDDSWAGGSGW